MIEYTTLCQVNKIATRCDMKYDESDPATMSLVFHFNDEIEWIVSRQLFKDILDNFSVGEGEVILHSRGDIIRAEFISPEGRGFADFRRDAIKEFVDQMYTLVPEGSDVYDMSDETLQNWLDSFA